MLVEAQALKRLTQDDVLCDVIRRLLREAALSTESDPAHISLLPLDR